MIFLPTQTPPIQFHPHSNQLLRASDAAPRSHRVSDHFPRTTNLSIRYRLLYMESNSNPPSDIYISFHTKVEIERNSLDARDNSVPPNCQSSTRDLFLHNAKHRLEHPLNHPPPPQPLSDTKRRVGVRFATITLFIFLSLFDLPNSIFVMMRTAHLKAIGDADGGRGERKNAV